LSAQEHSQCFVCGQDNESGLGLVFEATETGAVTADIMCSDAYQGYPKWLHGGIASTLLDGAMANCLFANGAVGATGELSVRFRDSIKIENPIFVKAWITRFRPPLFMLEAELCQNAEVVVTAKGKFMGELADVCLEG